MQNDAALSFVVLGCGARGQAFAGAVAGNAALGRVVAVAEPQADRRNRVGDQHGIPGELRFSDWKQLVDRPKLADAVINTLMDQLHVSSSIAALKLGNHMILEKPMATELHDCIEIDAWRRRSERIVSVCHSLRYHPTYRRIKSLLDENAIGQIVSLDQLEGVDPIHQSHSFVRGNWGNEGRSAFMLLAKSCHDIDVIMHLIGRSCQRVSSFGSLSHFKATERPAGAPDRCSAGCPHEKDCPYSAFKVYGQGMSWGGYIGLNRLTQAERDEFVRSSPYGLCVYNTDNDVVDHQVVNFEFEGGATATFTMTAFAPGGRRVRIHGSHGYINADIEAHTIDLHRFWGSQTKPETIVVPREEGGHGGGDANILSTFFRAVRENDPSLVLSDTAESLRTHTVTFAAEASRRQQQVVEIDQFIEHAMGSFAAVCNQ